VSRVECKLNGDWVEIGWVLTVESCWLVRNLKVMRFGSLLGRASLSSLREKL
jgi:hypothetical protein